MPPRLLPVLLLLAGCPDPSVSTDAGEGKAGGPAPTAPLAPPDGAVAPPPEGAPAGAPGGVPGELPPPPAGGVRPDNVFQVTSGQSVKISGTVSYSGTRTGDLRVDFLKSNVGAFPELAHSITLPKPGPFEVEAPKGYGELSVVAFLDADGNGPSEGEPAARIEGTITVADADITGLSLTLSDAPNLGDLKPPGAGGGKPPGDATTGGPTQSPGANPATNPTGGPTATPAGGSATPTTPAAPGQ